jgi:hypothetical protein
VDEENDLYGGFLHPRPIAAPDRPQLISLELFCMDASEMRNADIVKLSRIVAIDPPVVVR